MKKGSIIINPYEYAQFSPVVFVDAFGWADLYIVSDPSARPVNWEEVKTNFKATGFDNVHVIFASAKELSLEDARKMTPAGNVTLLLKSNFVDEQEVLGTKVNAVTVGQTTQLYQANSNTKADEYFKSESIPRNEEGKRLKNFQTNIVVHELGHGLGLLEHSTDSNNIMIDSSKPWMIREIRGFSPTQQDKIRDGIQKHIDPPKSVEDSK